MDASTYIMLFADSAQWDGITLTANLKAFPHSGDLPVGKLVLDFSAARLELPSSHNGLLLWSVDVRNPSKPSRPRIFEHNEEVPLVIRGSTHISYISLNDASILSYCIVGGYTSNNEFRVASKQSAKPPAEHPSELC